MRLLVTALAIFLLVLLTETFMYPHYAAPVAGLVAAIDLMAMRWMWRVGPPIGRLLVRTSVAVFFLWSAFWWIGFYHWKQSPDSWMARRQWVANDYLGQRPGKHLVLVRYGDHNVHEEWVYNGADLAAQKVIWARDLGNDRNQDLLEAFKDRQVWVVEPEGKSKEPMPYVKSR
jgi:hypothetical protein